MEKLKLWIHLHQADIKGFLLKFLPILFLIFFLIKLPISIRNYTLSKFDAETIGIVDSIEKSEGIRESEFGGKIIIKKYKINYHFHIADKKISQSEIIDRNSVTLKQRIQLNQIEKGDSIFVKYHSNNFEKSKIEIK